MNAIEKIDGPLNSYLMVGFENDLKTFKYKFCSMEEMDPQVVNASFQVLLYLKLDSVSESL